MNVSCSDGKSQKDEVPFFPEDIFYHILICLPADFLQLCCKFVCKSWAKIIRDPAFIRAYTLRSKGGLFIQKYGSPYRAQFLELTERGEFSVTPLDCHFPGRMAASCGGMSLFCGSHPQSFLRVGNIATKQFESLPFPIAQSELFPAYHIAYVPRTGEYKVVCHCVCLTGAHRWIVLTVGKDKTWRKLDTPLTRSRLDHVERTSVAVEGVLYWSQWSSGIYAIDLYDETTHFVQLPNAFAETSYGLLDMGGSLSCVSNYHAELHIGILKDLYSGEWAKLYRIRAVIDIKRYLCKTFVPIGWLDHGQIFVYSVGKLCDWKERSIVAYYVETGETRTFDDFNSQLVQIHTDTPFSW